MTAVRETSCKDCLILDRCVLSNLTEAQLDEMDKQGIVCRYKKKQRIFYQGEPCLGLFILCSGQVKLTRANRFGKEQITGIINPPGLLEEKDLFTTERHGVSAEAIEDVTVTFLKKEVLLDLFKKNPETALTMIVKLAQELEGAQDRIEAMTFKDGRRRLAELLLKLAAEYGRASGDVGVCMATSGPGGYRMRVGRGSIPHHFGFAPLVVARDHAAYWFQAFLGHGSLL